jgi:hypothetical protein
VSIAAIEAFSIGVTEKFVKWKTKLVTIVITPVVSSPSIVHQANFGTNFARKFHPLRVR